MDNNKIVANSGLYIQNAFVELTNDNHSAENALYWINKYIGKDDKICKIKKLLEIAQANIDEAYIMLDNIVSK